MAEQGPTGGNPNAELERVKLLVARMAVFPLRDGLRPGETFQGAEENPPPQSLEGLPLYDGSAGDTEATVAYDGVSRDYLLVVYATARRGRLRRAGGTLVSARLSAAHDDAGGPVPGYPTRVQWLTMQQKVGGRTTGWYGWNARAPNAERSGNGAAHHGRIKPVEVAEAALGAVERAYWLRQQQRANGQGPQPPDL